MMVEFKWISLFLPAVLQFTAAAEKLPPSFTVRVGDEVTLPCENVIDSQQKCENTTWLFFGSGNTAAVELIKLGQIGEKGKSKSDRLSVTENCSLFIKKVTVDDVGYYTCRQFKSAKPNFQDSHVHLSVIIMTERKDADEVMLTCSVSTHERHCSHTVKWLYEGKDVDKDMKTSESFCSPIRTTMTSLNLFTSRFYLFICAVNDGTKVQEFPFRFRPSGEKPGKDRITTTESTITASTENRIRAGTTTTASAINDSSTELQSTFWWFIIVGVAALLITVVFVVGFIRWKKTKGKKPQMDENTGRSLNPAVSPESSQDTADPEDGVSYASISYTRKTNSKGRVLGKDGDDEDDAVTYSSVKASSSSAGASADPSDLYATVNKPNK